MEVEIVKTELVSAEIVSTEDTVEVGSVSVIVNNTQVPINLDNGTVAKLLQIIDILTANQVLIFSRIDKLEVSLTEVKIHSIKKDM